jgi:hypothetical protein
MFFSPALPIAAPFNAVPFAPILIAGKQVVKTLEVKVMARLEEFEPTTLGSEN